MEIKNSTIIISNHLSVDGILETRLLSSVSEDSLSSLVIHSCNEVLVQALDRYCIQIQPTPFPDLDGLFALLMKIELKSLLIFVWILLDYVCVTTI